MLDPEKNFNLEGNPFAKLIISFFQNQPLTIKEENFIQDCKNKQEKASEIKDQASLDQIQIEIKDHFDIAKSIIARLKKGESLPVILESADLLYSIGFINTVQNILINLVESEAFADQKLEDRITCLEKLAKFGQIQFVAARLAIELTQVEEQVDLEAILSILKVCNGLEQVFVPLLKKLQENSEFKRTILETLLDLGEQKFVSEQVKDLLVSDDLNILQSFKLLNCHLTKEHAQQFMHEGLVNSKVDSLSARTILEIGNQLILSGSDFLDLQFDIAKQKYLAAFMMLSLGEQLQQVEFLKTNASHQLATYFLAKLSSVKFNDVNSPQIALAISRLNPDANESILLNTFAKSLNHGILTLFKYQLQECGRPFMQALDSEMLIDRNLIQIETIEAILELAKAYSSKISLKKLTKKLIQEEFPVKIRIEAAKILYDQGQVDLVMDFYQQEFSRKIVGSEVVNYARAFCSLKPLPSINDQLIETFKNKERVFSDLVAAKLIEAKFGDDDALKYLREKLPKGKGTLLFAKEIAAIYMKRSNAE